MRIRGIFTAAIFLTLWLSGNLFAGTFKNVTVDARSDIFDAGDDAPSRDGILPVLIDLPKGRERIIVFTAVTGATRASADEAYWPLVGADGGTESVTGIETGTNIISTDGISGILHNRFLFLSGVFLDNTSPDPGYEPERLDFTSIGSEFPSIRPEIAQTFFIGDGFKSIGIEQRFNIPDSATRLFLGFADASGFGWPNGLYPGRYADNIGELKVEYYITSSCQYMNNLLNKDQPFPLSTYRRTK